MNNLQEKVMDLELLRSRIIDQFNVHFSVNDPAHREEHFDEVFTTGVYINNVLNLGYDPKLIMYAAFFHDLFAWSRVNHHELSYAWVKTTDHPILCELKTGERDFVAIACLEHRASFTGNFTLEFSELFNSADRGCPGNIDAKLQRAIDFRLHRHPEMSLEEVREGAVEHLKEKFGVGGYARYPKFYLKAFGDILEQQREYISRL